MVLKLSSISFHLAFGFWPMFYSEASHEQHCAHGPKTTLKLSVHVQAITPNPKLKLCFQSERPGPPLKTILRKFIYSIHDIDPSLLDHGETGRSGIIFLRPPLGIMLFQNYLTLRHYLTVIRQTSIISNSALSLFPRL